MGNSIGSKRKGAKVMKVDGTSFRVKTPAMAGDVLREYPGYNLLESEEVKLLGVKARPLDHDATLRHGKLYFLVELPKVPDKRVGRRAWSGALQVGAKERLEGLLLARRSTSDLSLASKSSEVDMAVVEHGGGDGGLRIRMKLPKAQVAKLMSESKDSAEAAQKIMALCSAPTPPDNSPAMTASTPDRMAWAPDRSPAITPERSSFARTPDSMTSPGAKTGRKEKRTRFVALPDEIIA